MNEILSTYVEGWFRHGRPEDAFGVIVYGGKVLLDGGTVDWDMISNGVPSIMAAAAIDWYKTSELPSLPKMADLVIAKLNSVPDPKVALHIGAHARWVKPGEIPVGHGAVLPTRRKWV